MDNAVLICRHCGAPLPRQARWRAVSCAYCGALNAALVKSVDAGLFKAAWQRAQAGAADVDAIACAGSAYRLIAPLATGEHARVVLAQRIGAMPERVVLKIALDGAPAGRLRREHEVLTALQDPLAAGAAYFSQRLQQPVALGADTLALRVPSGFWGSLDQVQANYPDGVDARHVVWMWRRILEVLAYAHAAGWSHGRLHPGHLLVQPRDHGILIIGWAGATAAGAASCARDLQQAAWSMRAMLAPPRDANPPGMPAAVPAPLASLLRRASEDAAWCRATGAGRLDELLQVAAAEAFGAPRFIDFSPARET